jgi:putative holliday junction resolvase
MSISEKSSRISKILGIDFGKSKVGLALADSETKMAFAYDTLENNKKLIENLKSIIEKEDVSKVTIGIPNYKNGETIENEARKLGEELEKSNEVQVFYADEMFTTKMARANLIERGMKEISKSDDKEAARIILQEWLDNN